MLAKLISSLPILLITLNFLHGSEISQDSCNGEVLLVHCRCHIMASNDLALQANLYSGLEARLECNGAGALRSANRVLKATDPSLVYTELEISSSKPDNWMPNSLKGFSGVSTLTLPNNSIEHIDLLKLEDFKNLEKLDLSYNQIRMIRKGTFDRIPNLKNLTLSDNKIYSIDGDVFRPLQNLRYLDLSNNNLFVVNEDWFATADTLEALMLSSNSISAITTEAFSNMPSLTLLDLSGNRIKDIPQGLFLAMKRLKQISLAGNRLESLGESSFRFNKQMEHINLTGNLWVCDKQMLPLYDWLKIHEVDRSYCAEPPDFVNTTLQNGLNILMLRNNINESPICNTSTCNCSVSRDKLVITVDCIGRGLTKLPGNLPSKTRVLDLGNNNIRSLMLDHVNATQWADVTFLHLNNNLIDTLKGLEGTWLLRNLVALHLTNNQLTEIPIHILEQFKGELLDEIYLSGNPWNCDCNTVRFQTWLQDNYKTIRDFDRIRCSSESGLYSDQVISRMLKSQLCPQDVEVINYLDVLNGLMAVAILLIIMKLSFDFWLQKRTGKLPRFFSLNMS